MLKRKLFIGFFILSSLVNFSQKSELKKVVDETKSVKGTEKYVFEDKDSKKNFLEFTDSNSTKKKSSMPLNQEKKEKQSLPWQSLFNGENLDGWKPKIRGYQFGDNHKNTFQVRDHKLVVSYDEYETFDRKFGHLFYWKPFSAYYLAVEYRFIGEQLSGGKNWAWRNSGIMLHSQAPENMEINQKFPISLEAQLLGGNGKKKRPNLNLCTPGTEVFMNDRRVTSHCIDSKSKTFHGDQWVRVGVLVLKDSVIKHYIHGKSVLEYSKPRISGKTIFTKMDGKFLDKGYLSVQSESHPIEFRKIEIIDLENIYDNKEKLQKQIQEILEYEIGK